MREEVRRPEREGPSVPGAPTQSRVLVLQPGREGGFPGGNPGRAPPPAMGYDDLDVTIQIPEPIPRCQASADPERRERVHQQPVVILLGWGGCTDKNLSKYSTIYFNRGCIVIRYTAPWQMVFFAEPFGIPSLRSPAKKLLELLFDYEIEKKPLLFHVFSNAGVMLYRYVVDLIHTHRQFSHLQVVGTIFDSAPGNSNLVGAVRALSAILENKQPALRIFLLLTFALAAVFVWLVLSPVTAIFHVNYYDALMKQSSRWPELYLYSKADRIIRACDIEHMVVARLEQQVLVRAVDFSASAHVSHLRDYPTYYTSLCLSFLYNCVNM
ncbi:transmembrane protein 53-like isoform X2 [Petaurus breviceps papuanus]|uniref:transmembrane protein 53-like isoform X2 n=1 Tax=Petaurus breviceps papuanus TaxID=3040969 RepID=UPI0036D88E43